MQHEERIFIAYHPERTKTFENLGHRSMVILNLGPYDHRIEACGLSRSVTLDLQRPNEYEWPVIVWNIYHEIQLA